MTKVKIENLEIGTSELAAIIGKSSQWIRQLTREGVLTQISRGKYKLSEAVQAFYEFKTGENSDNNLNYNREKALLTRAKRKLEENNLLILEGKLHLAEDVERVMNHMLLTCRNRLLAIPAKVAPDVVGEKNVGVVQKIIRKEVYSALTELSNYDPDDFKPQDLDEFITNDESEFELVKELPKKNKSNKKTKQKL